jgi:hypothetical protein
VTGTVLADRIAPTRSTTTKEARMTTRRRITTAVLASFGFAISATPALALPTDLTPNGSEVPAGSPSVTSQATVPTPPPTIVRVSANSGGFDWGDAGIGAGGGFAFSMIVAGGALVASQRRGRRTHGSAAPTG